MKKNPKHIRILGKGKGWQGCPDNDSAEIWALNGLLFAPKKIDRIFMMDVIDEMPSVVSGNWQVEDVIDRINDLDIPLVAPYEYEEIPKSEAFPIEEAAREFGVPYFNNTIAYMICYALLKGVRKIEIWGINQASGTEYFYEKGCVEYWIGIATGYGLEVEIHGKHSELLTNKARYGGNRLYGYNAPFEKIVKSKEKFGDVTVKKLMQPEQDTGKVITLGPRAHGMRSADILGVRELWQKFAQHPEGRWIISLNDALNLARIARDNEPERVLDLGTGIGASSAVLRHILPESEIVSIEQFEKCVNIAEQMTDDVEILHRKPELFELDEVPEHRFVGYEELPEGPWDLVVIDGPGDIVHNDVVLKPPCGDVFRIIDDINEGGLVYVDGRKSTAQLIKRFLHPFLTMAHSGKGFTVFMRNNKPYNEELVVDGLKQHLIQNNYFHAN